MRPLFSDPVGKPVSGCLHPHRCVRRTNGTIPAGRKNRLLRWVFLGLIIVACTQPKFVAADAPNWLLHSDDTELRIAVVEHREVIQELRAVGSSHNWIEQPAAIPLMDKVGLDGQELSLNWHYRTGTFDADAGRLTLVFTPDEAKLTLRSVWQARPGKGPIEHWMEVENQSGARVTVSHQDSLSLSGLRPSGPASLWWIRRGGSNASTQGGTIEQPLAAGVDLALASDCLDGASPVPWLAVQVGTGNGLYVGWEFSGLGRIHARADGDQGDRLALDVGHHAEFKTDVEPGEVFLVPTAFVGCYLGDLDEGSYALHRFVLEKLRPPLPHDCPDPILAYNLYLDVGGNQATEADVLRSVATCRDLGFEAFMPDAMWFPETGDWRWDPRRFPHGVQPIEERVHGSGMQLALWCAWTNGGVATHVDALRVRGPAGHPDWFNADYAADWQPGPFYGGQVCLACPAAQQWAAEKTKWLVKYHRLDYLKHDINPIVTQCNKASHRHRYGVDTSYWATLGYYKIQQQLRETYPNLILENCSGGGHIKDFGVAAQTHYTVATDTLSNLPNRQAMYDSTRALPPRMLQCYTYDNYYPVRGDNPGTYLWRTAMMGAWQIDPTDTPKWTEEEKASVRRSVEIYRQWIRPMLVDVKVHHILPRPDGLHWDGMFYWSSSQQRGTLYVWRPDSPDAQHVIRLKGLEPDGKYWLWSEDGSLAPGLKSGAELIGSGVTIELLEEYSSDLIFVQDQSLGKPVGLEPPGSFRLQQAKAQGGLFSATARLAWKPAAGARSYRLCVAGDADFHDILMTRRVTQPVAELDNVPPGQSLYWRVEAIAWGGRRRHDGPPGKLMSPQLDRPTGLVFVSELPWTKANAGAENLVRRDMNYYGKPIAINGHVYPKGLWTHAYPDDTPADTVYDIAGKNFELFKAEVGLDDASGGGSVRFHVLVDGLKQAESPVMHPRQVHTFRVNIAGARQIVLRVTSSGDGYACDHAVWAAARLVTAGVRDPLD